MSLCFYVNSRCYTPSFMASLLMGTQIGGMDLRPRDKMTEWPVRYMFRSRGFPWISCEITRTIFFDLPIWDSNSSSFSCRSFSSQREPTVVGSIILSTVWLQRLTMGTTVMHVSKFREYLKVMELQWHKIMFYKWSMPSQCKTRCYFVLGLCPANERWRHSVTTSLTGCAQT